MSDVATALLDGHTCVVAFASGGGDFSEGVPHFEFGRSLAAMNLSYVLFRDSTHCNCHHGVKEIGDRNAVAWFVKSLKQRYPRIVTLGLSSGSYGALLYGQLAEVDECIALSPYTLFPPHPETGEYWCPPDLTQWDLPSPPPPGEYDLERFFPNGPIPRTRTFLSDGDGTGLDRNMAERIGIWDITLVPGTSHAGLGKLMRDNGMLKHLLAGGGR